MANDVTVQRGSRGTLGRLGDGGGAARVAADRLAPVAPRWCTLCGSRVFVELAPEGMNGAWLPAASCIAAGHTAADVARAEAG